MDSATTSSIFHGLTIFEIVINITIYIMGSLAFYIILKYPIFHTNFMRLIKCIIIHYFIAQFMRLIIAFYEVTGAEQDIEFYNVSSNYILISGTGVLTTLGTIRLFCLIGVYATTGTVALERAYATIKFKTYETTVSNKLFGVCIGYQLILGCIGTFGVYSGIITLVMVAVFMMLGTIIICIILWWLEKINKKCYKTSLIDPQRYSLSERFQIQENIKTTHIINRVATMVFFLNIFVASLILAAQYFQTDLLRRCAYNFFHICVTFYGYCVVLVGLSANPLWIHNFTRIFISAIKITPVGLNEAQKRISLSKQLLTHNGKQMVFTAEEEKEIYFDQLNNGWNK